MAAVVITQQRVQDYDIFCDAYAEAEGMRRDAGVLYSALYRLEGQPDVVATHMRFPTMDLAHAFSQSAEQQAWRIVAGVDEANHRVEFYETT